MALTFCSRIFTAMNSFDDPYRDPSNYKWGYFYSNPNDPRIFVPKRIGIGWTVNFGKPYVVIGFIVLFVAVILFSLLN